MTIYLETYQSFDNVQEMDVHIRQHTTEHYRKMTDTERDVLSCIARYACKYPGAAHLKVETICKEIKKSDATIRRALRKLEKLKIINKLSTIRKVSKGYGANILIILPFDDNSQMTSRSEDGNPSTTSFEGQFSKKETDHSLSKNNKLLHNTYSEEGNVRVVGIVDNVNNLGIEQTPTYYQRFKATIFSMLGNDQKTVSQLYGVYRSLSYRVTKSFPQFTELYETLGYQTLIITLQAMKQKKLRNVAGYYVGIFEKLYERDLFEFYRNGE
ncbi:helix-turn-helix domain-containing protein [Sporosarcina sp. 179-K 3D1 HS]|uniref:helix-turn-helix domain-containing protein n=1 Tax=Sporosarcina sp. 179-K 3D1 HS TaxID=3232169 RepID=UPI0039A3E561